MKEKNKEKEKKIKDKVQDKKEYREISNTNLFVFIVIIIIIITFIFGGSYSKNPLKGFKQFVSEFGKSKIKNEDGSISIPSEAQVDENVGENGTGDLYVGKVLGEKIQLYKDNEFTRNISAIRSYSGLNFIQKYQYARNVFDMAINKIIGMYNAKNMNIIISKDYLTKKIGEKYFKDSDGDINRDLMKKNINRINDLKDELLNELLYENFKKDYFDGNPVSYDEIYDQYKMDNVKVTLKYFDISNDDVPTDKIKSFLENNKENFKQYKLIRLVFKKKEDAETNIKKLQEDPKKFSEIGNLLKTEDKVINVIYDPDFSFLDDFEKQELADAVKSTPQDKVSDKIIETELGFIVFLVDKVQYASIDDARTFDVVKKSYLKKNIDSIEKQNKELADQVYNYAVTNGIDKAGTKFKLEAKTSSPTNFLGYGIPNVNADETDDLNYMIKIFKAKKGNILSPYKYKSGFMISEVYDKSEVQKETFENLYNDLYSRYSNEKNQSLEKDYYSNERKKITVVDNFRYVITYQLLMPSEGEQQQGFSQ